MRERAARIKRAGGWCAQCNPLSNPETVDRVRADFLGLIGRKTQFVRRRRGVFEPRRSATEKILVTAGVVGDVRYRRKSLVGIRWNVGIFLTLPPSIHTQVDVGESTQR